MTPPLSLDALLLEATGFAAAYSQLGFPELFGVDNGKTIGTHLEHEFARQLTTAYSFPPGNAAKGIDFPHLDVDLKTTSLKQPQSSCPFRSARQKVYGLGYSLLVFVYQKADDSASQVGRLHIVHTVFIDRAQTRRLPDHDRATSTACQQREQGRPIGLFRRTDAPARRDRRV